MKLPDDAQLVEWGVDWITVTGKDRETRDLMLREGKRLLDEAVDQGDEVCAFRWKGYEGWTSGSVDVANREDGCMIRLHGHSAQEDWWDVAQFAQNCSRLDFQLTYRSESESVDHVLARAYKAVTRTKLYGKPVEWHYRRDSRKGNTLELGRRTSDKFGRMYDKGKESKLDHYRGCTRLEVEFKGDAAWSRLKALHGHSTPAIIIPSEVRTFFHDRGIICRRSPDDLSLLKTARPRRSVDKFLVYLERSVKPGVGRVIASRGLDAALDALGLSDLVQLKPGVERTDGPDGGDYHARSNMASAPFGHDHVAVTRK